MGLCHGYKNFWLVLTVCTGYKLESTGYNALPSLPRLLQRAVAAWQTHSVTQSITVPSPLAKQRRRQQIEREIKWQLANAGLFGK